MIMIERFDIAGYARISVDEELDRDNVSIENQKSIIEDFVTTHFPNSTLTFFEDRDRSGYTFDQREGYQELRRGLMSHKYDILIVKDFSRFSRRNSRGLVELEDLRDAGVRIISIGDNIDFPNDDDWLKIQFQFLINEMPVTDTSKKVRSVVKRRQEEGRWLCAAPYGYILNKQQVFEVVPTEAEVIRTIFKLYLDGWGYKKIANYLTDNNVPTPRMSECERRAAAGEPVRRKTKAAWAIVTVQGILDNDFYIGTLRQGKFTRVKINGTDRKLDESEHRVFEHHHQEIIDYRTFATVRSLRESRSTNNYRGVKVNDNVYSGLLVCGDCGSPMFAMSRSDLAPAYTCGTYHRRGRKGCTSHHIRAETLDALVKDYVRKVRDNSSSMLERLNADLEKEQADIAETKRTEENLEALLLDKQEELKATKRQRIRDIMKHPEQEALLDETYDELEAELTQRIAGIQHQIEFASDKCNTIIRINRVAKTAMDVFHDILEKPSLDRNDLNLMIEKIRVFEDHIEVQLKADIDSLLKTGALPEDAVNFNWDTENSESKLVGSDDSVRLRVDVGINPYETEIVQGAAHRKDKVFRVSVISSGDPLEIYTEKDGEVIFKKYSPMGDLTDFAGQICESIGKNTGHIAAVCDRDTMIAAYGVQRRELMDKHCSQELEQLMESRKFYRYQPGQAKLHPTDSSERYYLGVSAPILSEGDLMGCVMLLLEEQDEPLGDAEQKLVQTVAGFLGRQMES